MNLLPMKDIIHFEAIATQHINAEWLSENNVTLDILRLDEMHPVISGNKWFKLKYYLQDAEANGFETIGTFGGAYSNHIIATAFACKAQGIRSIGIIRGEQPAILSQTLEDAKLYGMELDFVNRTAYRDTKSIQQKFDNEKIYWINEGGYGKTGAKGAGEILNFCSNAGKYSHIVCAVGTGTMLAGIADAVEANQQVIGVSVMKENFALSEKVKNILANDDHSGLFKIVHDYHFGGYAKHPPELINYMNQLWLQHSLPTDIVYTSKTFFAVEQMIRNNTIPQQSNVLMIHSGGLQGNLSLPANTLLF